MNGVKQVFVQIWKWIVNNKDFLIALIALIFTILQYVSSRIRNKEKYEIKADKVEIITVENKTVLLIKMSIINCSSSTLHITKMIFANSNNNILCNLNKTWSGEHYYPKFPETDIPRTERIFSAQFPISIQPNGAVSELIRFESDEKISIMSDCLMLEISTNKKTRKICIKYNDK